MTGFGRTGTNFGVDFEGVRPDIMVGGKGLSGGYAPIGGVYATDAVVEPLRKAGQDLMFYTFSGHPASLAISEKVLEIMQRENLVERVGVVGKQLRERLKVVEDHPNVAQVRGRGLMLGVEFVKDKETLERFPKEARFTPKGGRVGPTAWGVLLPFRLRPGAGRDHDRPALHHQRRRHGPDGGHAPGRHQRRRRAGRDGCLTHRRTSR